jgi:NMD protein affecting ribosome stability and mRNA decay
LGLLRVLYSLSNQIAHCYVRAEECRKLAALSQGETDRQFYIERERAWLKLARSYELSERISRFSNELERHNHLRRTEAPSIAMEFGPPNRSSCAVPMDFEAGCPDESRTVDATVTLEFALCVCPNCGRVRDQIVTKPRL